MIPTFQNPCELCLAACLPWDCSVNFHCIGWRNFVKRRSVVVMTRTCAAHIQGNITSLAHLVRAVTLPTQSVPCRILMRHDPMLHKLPHSQVNCCSMRALRCRVTSSTSLNSVCTDCSSLSSRHLL